MKITKSHIQFYYAKKVSAPSFGKLDVPDINSLINVSAGIKHDLDKHNLLNIIKMSRKNGKNLIAYLIKICYSPGTVINPGKRSAFAYRLLKRIRKDKENLMHPDYR